MHLSNLQFFSHCWQSPIIYSSFAHPVQDPTERFHAWHLAFKFFKSPLISNRSSELLFVFHDMVFLKKADRLAYRASLRLGPSEMTSGESCPNMWVWFGGIRLESLSGRERKMHGDLSVFFSFSSLTEKFPTSLIEIGFKFFA